MIPIVKGLVDSCWFFLKCSLLAGLIAGAFALPQLLRRVDEVVRKRIEAKLAGCYPNLRVTVRSAELIEGKGIVVRGVRIADPGSRHPCAELVHLEEVYLSCPTDLEELLKSDLEVRHVVIRRPTLRVAQSDDGSWNVGRLLPLPQLGSGKAGVEIESGSIELWGSPSGALVLREIGVTLSGPGPAALPAGDGPAGDGHSAGTTKPDGGVRARKFQGHFTGDMLRRVEFEGLLDPEGPGGTLCGSVAGLEISPHLRESLPAPWAARLAHLGSLRGEASLDFRLGYDPKSQSPCDFEVTGHLLQGRLDDPRLPHSLTDLQAAVRLDPKGVSIRDLSARSGQATLQMSCRRDGYEPESPLSLEATIRDLELDRSLAEILPDVLRREWPKFLPSGQVHASVRLGWDGRRWEPELTLQCLNVAFTYHKLPYRLEHTRGVLELKNGLLTADLRGYGGTREIRVTAEIRSPLEGPYGWVKANGAKLPLDEKLLSALTPKVQAAMRMLAPQGTIDFEGRVWRERPDDVFHRHLLAELNHCGICCEKFPYPISNVTGTAEMLDDQWTFRDLVGTNDTGRITCGGTLSSAPEGSRLDLRLTGTSVPLEEELRDAMSPGMRQVWDDFRPQGMVDLRDVHVQYASAGRKLSVSFQAEPRRENASIQPVRFPYRLERLQGLLDYRDGQVAIGKFRGEHGNVTVASDGQGALLPGGGWTFRFDNLFVDRLRFDRELVQALPAFLKKTVGELSPTGPFYLRGGPGAVSFQRHGNPEDPLTSKWDLDLGFHQASIEFGPRLENLHGVVHLAGEHDGEQFRCRGELDVDSMSCRDVQLTRVKGPLWIDNQRVLFGTWVDRPAPGQPAEAQPPEAQPADRPARSLSAELFGGVLLGDVWIALGSGPRYSVTATLRDADLARAALDLLPGHRGLRGRLFGSVDLRGTGRSLGALTGRGAVRLRDADVYELPLMVSLLKILSIRRPDRTAFISSDVDFHVEHGRLNFERLNLNGDAVSLLGTGEVDFQGNMNLVFHSTVGRGDLGVPVLRDVLGGASQQIMQIRVGGTLQEPETRREPFPGVNQALQQLQGDAPRERGDGPRGLLPLDARRRPPPQP